MFEIRPDFDTLLSPVTLPQKSSHISWSELSMVKFRIAYRIGCRLELTHVLSLKRKKT